MLAAVKLDRQLRFPACKVNDKGLDDQLPGETGAKVPQTNPQ
jgi:hypothetical protein